MPDSPAPSLMRPRPYTTASTRVCIYCTRELNAKGYASHEKACRALTITAKRDREFESQLALEEEERSNKRPRMVSELSGANAASDDDESVSQQGRSFQEDGAEMRFNSEAEEVPSGSEDEQEPEIDDIKVEYHPSSRCKPIITHFHEFKRTRAALDIPPEEEPFRPFRCRTDFEFARIAMDAALKPDQINALLKIIKDVASGSKFTISNARDLSRTWEEASILLTPFREEEITVPLLKEERIYKVWYRPLWDWTLDLLNDIRLLPHFTWDAERLYKYDGITLSFIRFIDEPWTADRFWEIQSALPIGSHPLCWILYADKSKISSFGTVKGYPVIVRCANLPAEIRNGTGIGGGRIVGWIPVVDEDSDHSGKTSFVNHKYAVWHKALELMLRTLVPHAKDGYSFIGADGVERKIYPCILILSADYEEQCVMTLIRGLKGYCPCPVCYVDAKDQSDLSVAAELRCTERSERLFEKAKKKTKKKAEEAFKKRGLRRVYNTFWNIPNSDPYRAVSWDRLHSYSLGMFGDHMWSDFKSALIDLGREAQRKIDEQMSQMPRFRNLHHFDKVVHISFNDGSKFEDLAKQFFFAAHNILTSESSKHGYQLLRCLRVFLILDTFLSFEVHTEDTVQAGKKELQNFSKMIAEYMDIVPESNKKRRYTQNWNFIKMHYQLHAFDDVLAKGASRNFGTKYNEKLHKPLRDAYHQRTNFKDVTKQILKFDHYLLVSTLITSKLKDLDEYNLESSNEKEDTMGATLSEGQATLNEGTGHHHLGSIQPKCTFSELEAAKSDDAAFQNFRTKLGTHLADFLSAHSIPLPNGRNNIRISKDDTITEYRFLKINYENLVTWKESTDYLRCHPDFHGRPRYDFVVVRTVQRTIFARLLCMFNVVVDGKDYPTALVQPCDAAVGRLYHKDIDLEMMRVRAKPRHASEFISIQTIVRGAVLVPDFDKDGEFLVMDTLDSDMFLRVRKMLNIW